MSLKVNFPQLPKEKSEEVRDLTNITSIQRIHNLIRHIPKKINLRKTLHANLNARVNENEDLDMDPMMLGEDSFN
jgi:hypothetical protein